MNMYNGNYISLLHCEDGVFTFTTERMVKRFGVHSAATSGVKVLEKLLLEQKQPRFRYAHFWPRNVF